jgi:hypothetical protein
LDIFHSVRSLTKIYNLKQIYDCIYIYIYIYIYINGPAFNVTHFESRITHLLYTAINTTEQG